MSGIAIYEFDALSANGSDFVGVEGVHAIPANVFGWLEGHCLRAADEGAAAWLRLTQRRGRRVVQVTSFVGVICAPNGYQIEVLPKLGKAVGGSAAEARQLLIQMLCCLQVFRHVQTDSAKLAAARMPLLEVFIAEFLRAVEHIVKRGLRGDYTSWQDNLFALRGKLLMAPHVRQNLYRADRFYTEYDEYSTDRAENRLLHAALRRVLLLSTSQVNQKLTRELDFAFADVPVSVQPRAEFQRVKLDRGMGYYTDALAWTRVILEEVAPHLQAPAVITPHRCYFLWRPFLRPSWQNISRSKL